MRYHVVVEEDGSFVLPPELMREFGLEIGDEVAMDRIEGGFTMRRIEPVDA